MKFNKHRKNTFLLLCTIISFFISSCSNNVYYKYTLWPDEKFEKKINNKLYSHEAFTIKGDFIELKTEDILIVLDMNCLDEFSFSYSPIENVIFVNFIEKCDKVPAKEKGLSEIRKQKYFRLSVGNTSDRHKKRILKILEYIENLIYKKNHI